MSKTFQNSQVPNIIQSFTGFKNKLINGGFHVWQRSILNNSTTFEYFDNYDGYQADRQHSMLASHTQGGIRIFPCNEVPTGNPGMTAQSIKDSKGNYLNTDDSNATNAVVTGFSPFNQLLEGWMIYDEIITSQEVTVSFLFRSNVKGTYSVALRQPPQGHDSNGNELGFTYVTDFEYDGSNEWRKIIKTIKFDGEKLKQYVRRDNTFVIGLYIASYFPSHMTNVTDEWTDRTSGTYAQKYIPFCSKNATKWYANPDAYVSISDVQLEVGSEATEFENLPFDINLARCMRYCQVLKNVVHRDDDKVTSAATKSHSVIFQPMRSVPKVTVLNISSTSNTSNTRVFSASENEVEFGCQFNNTNAVETAFARADILLEAE
jgi:hypothetical protein